MSIHAILIIVSDEELFHGGVNAVRRVGSTIERPIGDHTPTVHRLLRHLRSKGLDKTPDVLGLDLADGIETLSFMPGESASHPVAEAFRTDETLVAAASLLRSYHDATADFVTLPHDQWFLGPRGPAEVICHGDFAPYNCSLTEDNKLSVFDFDTAHPGPRIDDVGYAAYRWVPLTSPDNDAGFGDVDAQAKRLRLFCETYGIVDLVAVVEAAIDRLRALIKMMRDHAAHGHSAFAQHVADGHDSLYAQDISYMAENLAELSSG